jgi:hypothetical protein
VTCFCADHTLTSLPKSPMETKSPRKTVTEGSVRCDVNQILWQQRFAEKVGNMLGFSLALTAWCKTNLLATVDRKVVHPHQVCFGACWSLFQASYKSLNTRQTKHSKTAFTALTTWQQFVCCAATRLHRTQGSKKQQRTWQLGASRHADFFEG